MLVIGHSQHCSLGEIVCCPSQTEKAASLALFVLSYRCLWHHQNSNSGSFSVSLFLWATPIQHFWQPPLSLGNFTESRCRFKSLMSFHLSIAAKPLGCISLIKSLMLNAWKLSASQDKKICIFVYRVNEFTLGACWVISKVWAGSMQSSTYKDLFNQFVSFFFLHLDVFI